MWWWFFILSSARFASLRCRFALASHLQVLFGRNAHGGRGARSLRLGPSGLGHELQLHAIGRIDLHHGAEITSA
jgi:hypothetical protein